MSEDFGNGGEGGNRNRRVDLQPIQHLHQIFIPMYGNAMVFGDRNDLGGNCTPPFGENPRKIIAITIITKGYSGLWIFGHHPILSGFEAIITPRRIFISW